jgi:hypothetical protein
MSNAERVRAWRRACIAVSRFHFDRMQDRLLSASAEQRVETPLAEFRADLLQVELVGWRDNYFRLGGCSVLAVRVISHVAQLLGVAVGLAKLSARHS